MVPPPLRGIVVRGVRAEGADGTRGEDRAFVGLRDIERVDQRGDVQVPGHARHVFAFGAEQCDEVIDRIDLVFDHQLVEFLLVEHVEFLRNGRAAELFDQFVFQICRNYIIFAINMLEIRDQFGTDLSARSNHKNPFHTFINLLIFRFCPQI